MNQQPTYLLDRCKGINERQCPHTLFSIDTFVAGLGKKIEESGWEFFLLKTYGGKHHFHHAFRVAVSGCANSCARSHIADFGMIRAQRPILEPGRCNGCEACVEACPDRVISMVDGCPVIDRDECLLCGLCIQSCPEQAMQVGKEGWRVLVGGRLGRRPQLAWELPGLRSEEDVFAILGRSLKLYMKNYRKGLRFGALLSCIGLDLLDKDNDELDTDVC
ncbi:MAG: 4Fe-4S binding protein [Desulfovibrionaceae bacterium]